MSPLSEHTAAPHLAGYIFQVDRALHCLASNPTATGVAVELLDDLTVLAPEGARVLEQSKTTAAPTGDPLGDRRPDLWKSLATWADAIASGEIDPATTEFHLVTNRALQPGLAQQMANIAGQEGAARTVLEALKSTAPGLSTTTRTHANSLLAHSDTLLLALLQHIHCYSASDATSDPETHADIAAHLRLTDSDDDEAIINGLRGWIFGQVLSLIHAGQPALITTAAFNTQLSTQRTRSRLHRAREQPGYQILVSEQDRADHAGRRFVDQLALIDADDEEVLDAIKDFVRHSHERLRLSRQGEIADEEWIAFDDRLVEHWKPLFRPHRNCPDEQCISRGRAVYSEAQQHRGTLAGFPTSEPYFTRGAYHSLSDQLTVGWHPRYTQELT